MMKGGVKVVVVAGVAGLAMMMMMMMAMVEPGEAKDCTYLESLVAPCLEYVSGGTDDPSATCCGNVSVLKSETPTTADRRAACECLKQSFSGAVMGDRDALLPKRCGVELGVPFNKDINCNDIN